MDKSGSVGARRRTGTRERVLSTAGTILRRDGYSQLTMERVAAEAA
jgi:AcrR family transcriptional regulator